MAESRLQEPEAPQKGATQQQEFTGGFIFPHSKNNTQSFDAAQKHILDLFQEKKFTWLLRESNTVTGTFAIAYPKEMVVNQQSEVSIRCTRIAYNADTQTWSQLAFNVKKVPEENKLYANSITPKHLEQLKSFLDTLGKQFSMENNVSAADARLLEIPSATNPAAPDDQKEPEKSAVSAVEARPFVKKKEKKEEKEEPEPQTPPGGASVRHKK